MPKKETKNALEKRLLKSMQEAVDFVVHGDDSKGNMFVLFDGKRVDIRGMRAKLSMTREEFAKAFHFTVRSIQNWERGFRIPNDHTLAYLYLISKDPKYAYNLLNKKS